MNTVAGLQKLEDENKMLQAELNRVEDTLAQTRAEKDELSIKLNALSEKIRPEPRKLERNVAAENGEAPDDSVSRTLMQQNIELRRRLEEEHAGYKRKLQQYQDGQQRQAELEHRRLVRSAIGED